MAELTPQQIAEAATLEMKAISLSMTKATDETKIWANKAIEELKANKAMSVETKESADKALLALGEITTRMTDIEQKIARHGGGGPDQAVLKSLGELVIEQEEVKSRLLGGQKKGTVSFSLETKAIMSAAASWGPTASISTSLVPTDRQIGMLPIPMRGMTVRDLVAPGSTTSNALEYAIQTTRTNAAAVVAEGGLKPQSNYAWDLRSFPVRTVAHIVKASRQILDDAPGLQSIIDAEMRYGLAFAEENEMLYGDGTGVHILGVVPQASAYSAAFVVGGAETAIDRIRMAMLQGVLALFPMSGTVLNPTDWTKIEMLKDGMGRYIIGDPQGTIAPRLWGMPVVASLALTVNSFLTGAFKQAAQVFDRMTVEVLISTENNDDFEKNMISIRAEERLAFVVKRPGAFVTGTLP
jgi:HK97 family phage major capsid protein